MCPPPIARVARYVPHCKSLFHYKSHIYPDTYRIKYKSPCISLKIPIPLHIPLKLHITANLCSAAFRTKSLSHCMSLQIPSPLHITANPYPTAYCCKSLYIPLDIPLKLHIAANLYPAAYRAIPHPTACHCKSLSQSIMLQTPILLATGQGQAQGLGWAPG